GLTPALVAPGVVVAQRFQLARAFTLGAGALFLPMQPTSDGGYGFGLTALAADACAVAAAGRVTVSACAQVWFGALHAFVAAAPTRIPLSAGDHPWLALASSSGV